MSFDHWSLLLDWPSPITVHYDRQAEHGSAIMRGSVVNSVYSCKFPCCENVPVRFFHIDIDMYCVWSNLIDPLAALTIFSRDIALLLLLVQMANHSNPIWDPSSTSSLGYRLQHNMAAPLGGTHFGHVSPIHFMVMIDWTDILQWSPCRNAMVISLGLLGTTVHAILGWVLSTVRIIHWSAAIDAWSTISKSFQ